MKRLWLSGALLLLFCPLASAQMAAQIVKASASWLTISVDVKPSGEASFVVYPIQDLVADLLEKSTLRRDGTLESETDKFLDFNGVSCGSLSARFDAQSRLIEYSIGDAKGRRLSPTRVFDSQKTPRRVVYVSPVDKTKIVYSLNQSGLVVKKEIDSPQQNARVLATYNERGVRQQMTVSQGGEKTLVQFSYNAKKQLVRAASSGRGKSQMTFAYDANGRLQEMKTFAGKDVSVSSMTYTAQGKPLESSILKNGTLQLRFHYEYDEQNRPTSFEIRDGANSLTMQITTTYDADGKASSRTTAFPSNGKPIEMPMR